MIKQRLGALLRAMGLMHAVDYTRFWFYKVIKYRKNRKFRRARPNTALPPDYLMYESFQLDYEKYLDGGHDTADWVIGLFKDNRDTPLRRILDWGCGPARIVRHLPVLMTKSEIHACDYNHHTIQWCKQHIRDVTFAHNQLAPPLPYPDQHFDGIYGISIFTHLSLRLHLEWLTELARISAPEATVILTTHGKQFIPKLTDRERHQFEKGQLVIREAGREGHRVFSAFHPASYLRDLFDDFFKITAHIEGSSSGKPEQDVWILTKTDR